MKKVVSIIFGILIYSIFAFAVLLAFSAFWMLKTWPNLNMSELIFQLSQGFAGTGNDMLGHYFLSAGLPALIITVLMGIVLLIFRNGRWMQRMSLLISALLCAAIAVTVVYQEVDVADYVVSQSVESEFIQEQYADPASTKIVFPEQKRNLIYIFLESMEVTFADQANGGAFEANTIEELTRIAEENECFAGNHESLNGAYSMPATTWTMGGMFAQTSGLPLKVSINGNEMSSQDVFFPGIVTLGDILEDNGYTNRLLIGSDAAFGGRELYFKTHGNYQMFDYWHAVNTGLISENYYVWWGYEDKKLFDYAKTSLGEMSSSGEPFNLTILTADTHFEDGMPCQECPNKFSGNPYANVMACSSARVAAFLDWCKEQPWYENTTIVLAGDHPTMDTDFCNNIDSDYERLVYTAFINSAAENKTPERRRTYSTFDHFPTTLAAMGVQIEGDRLGLGTNLFSGKDTLSEELGEKEVADLLLQKSRFMEQKSGVTLSINDLRRDDSLIKADVEITAYNTDSGTLSLSLDHIDTKDEVLHSVTAVCEKNGISEYTKCIAQSNGKYTVDLSVMPQELSSARIKFSAVTEAHGKFHGSTLFEYAGDSLFWIGSVQNNPEGYLRMLNTIDLNRYCIFMSGCGNAAQGISDSVQQALFDLGFDTDLREHPNAAFYFVKDKDSILQKTSESYLEKYGYTAAWNPFVIISGAADSGSLSSIRISNGPMYTEYSPNKPGINIVIWDLEERRAVNTASFDTTTLLAQANLKYNITGEDENLVLKLTDIQNVDPEEIDWISVQVYDGQNPVHAKTAVFEKNEDGSYSATLSHLESDQCTVRVCFGNESGADRWFEAELNNISRWHRFVTIRQKY